MRNAFNRDHYRIIVSYRYHDNFDLSYRLSIKNSIWHTVTALYTNLCHSTRDYIAKMLKNAIYIFGYNGLTWGATAAQLTWFDSTRWADVNGLTWGATAAQLTWFDSTRWADVKH